MSMPSNPRFRNLATKSLSVQCRHNVHSAGNCRVAKVDVEDCSPYRTYRLWFSVLPGPFLPHPWHPGWSLLDAPAMESHKVGWSPFETQHLNHTLCWRLWSCTAALSGNSATGKACRILDLGWLSTLDAGQTLVWCWFAMMDVTCGSPCSHSMFCWKCFLP